MSKRRILVSVTDKSGIEKFKALTDAGWEVVSTGGTATALKELGVPCIPIEKVTGFPEMMNGRLKTLHPHVFGGILADRSKPEHLAAIAEHGIQLIDIVAVNLYAFDLRPSIEEIDIGGPSLLRAAAKNGAGAVALVDPNDYDWVIWKILKVDGISGEERDLLAMKVFEHTYRYDQIIYKWMKGKRPSSCHPSHSLRGSDATNFDYVCTQCHRTDEVPGGWGELIYPCSAMKLE